MKKFVFLLLFVVLLAALPAAAQQDDDACPVIVQSALEATNMACVDTERNQACYGNGLITAVLTSDDPFNSRGDVVELVAVQSLVLNPMDTGAGTWGVVLTRVQANLPDTLPGQNVTILLFGDVELTNAGRSMEAFYFRSGIGDAACAEAPDSGILIQTPQGVGRIELTINNVVVNLGSTAYLTAAPEEDLLIALLEGDAVVTAEDEEQVVEAGFFVTVPLDADLNAAGPPSEPEEIPEDAYPALPLNVLPLDITLEVEDGDEVVLSGENIVPRSGYWLFETVVYNVSGCPAAFAEIYAGAFQDRETEYVAFGERFDLETFMALFEDAEGGGEMPVEFVFGNPAPNQYTWSLSMEGSSFVYVLNMISPTEMTGTYNFSFAIPGSGNCALDLEFTVTHLRD